MDIKTQCIEVVCCYARKDQELLIELKTHLSPLQREGQITLWDDININAGMEWGREIDHHLNTAQIILLLVSPDFFASNYCYEIEMENALERHRAGEARVIPIILRSVDWNHTPLGMLQAVPKDAIPVTSSKWPNRDEAFTDVARRIRSAVIDKQKQLRQAEEEKRRQKAVTEQTYEQEREQAEYREALAHKQAQQQENGVTHRAAQSRRTPFRKANTLQVGLIISVILGVFASLFGGYQIHTHQVYASATATVAAMKYPSYLPGKGTLFAYDSLEASTLWNPQSHIWSESAGTCSFHADGYHVFSIDDSATDHTNPQYCHPNSNIGVQQLNNFVIQVQMTILSGYCGGVSFAALSDIIDSSNQGLGNDSTISYTSLIEICRGNTYLILDSKQRHFASDPPNTYTFSSSGTTPTPLAGNVHITLNQTYTIAVMVNSSKLSLFVDGKQVATNDLQPGDGLTSLPPDDAGLSAYADSNSGISTEVVFRQAQIWSLS